MKAENLLLGVASIIVAVLFWLQVQPLFEPGREREFAVPLRLENRPDTLVALPAAESVLVVASGTLTDLDRLDTSSVEAVVDLSRGKPGMRAFAVQVRGPMNRGIEIRPRQNKIQVTLETVKSKTLAVKVTTTDAPEGALVYQGGRVMPESVEVSGPASTLDAVTTAKVTFDLRKLKPGGTYSLPVELLDESGGAVPLMVADPPNVTLAPSVKSADIERNVPVNIEWKGQLPFGHTLQSIEITPPIVRLTGSSENIAKVAAVATEPVDLQRLKSERSMELNLVLPSGVGSETKTVQVKVTVRVR